MASNRHLGRIVCLQSLYEYEFRAAAGDSSVDIDNIIVKNIEPYSKALGDTDFVRSLTRGVFNIREELDKELQPIAPEWPISTISSYLAFLTLSSTISEPFIELNPMCSITIILPLS